jgi:hypothetical protein
LLFDAIFHFAAGAVAVFVQRPSVTFLRCKRSHHEAGIGAFRQMLGFAHHAPRAAPTLPRLVDEVGESAAGFPRGREFQLGLVQLATDNPL